MAASNIWSNPTRKVRVIAKIRGFTDQESESFNGSSARWISVNKHNEGGLTEKVTIFFGDKPAGGKYAYDMDYCYEQNEDFGLIFSREIKPLIFGVLDGQSASVIAYGARGSGKTCAIQGSEEKPGLATMAMTEILSMAEEIGKLITVSFYEVLHDHVYDLLNSNGPEVQVFKNAQGRIELKGLSQVAIKSMSEFHKLYFGGGCNSWKGAEKIGLKVPRRSHKGLMIHILSHDKNLNTKLLGKMNFVDLAGYEDARSSSDSTNLGESSKINKSLYALMNVVYAVNANESRVPYRESKLTRILQDSFGGTNRVLILTCLNPSFCQYTMHTVSLASRSFQVINRVTNSIKRSGKSSTKLSSVKNGNPATASTTMKKKASSGVRLHENKPSVITSGRKLFNDAVPSTTPKQAKFSLISASAILPDASLVMGSSCSQEEQANSTAVASLAIASTEEEILLPTAKGAESASMLEKEISTSPVYKALEASLLDKNVSPPNEINHKEATLVVVDSAIKAPTLLKKEDDIIGKENQSSLINEEEESPPLSARLRELSNNLKSLCSLTPKPQNITTPYGGQTTYTDCVEPKTPVMRANENRELQRFQSPREMFNNRSSGMKHSLVKDYLQFLNSATKEELKGLKGIGEKRATYILELREESPEPFKNLDDLQDIGLSAKQIKKMMKNVAGELFS